MKTENVAESHQTDIPYTFPAGHETRGRESAVVFVQLPPMNTDLSVYTQLPSSNELQVEVYFCLAGVTS